MRILVVSSTCSAIKYDDIYSKRFKPMLDTNQKFFLSLIDGLNANESVSVDCVTTLPISHDCYPDKIIKQQEEVVDGVSYHYCGCINYPIIRTLTVKHNIRKYVKKYIKRYKDENVFVLCDGLIAEANALIKLLKRKKIPSVALVTDVPNIVSDMNSKKGIKSFVTHFYGEYAAKLLQRFDCYVFLTEQMDELCNPQKHPFMIMECIVTPIELVEERKPLADKPVVLYAGKLHSDFGILQLAKAAKLLEDDCEIWMYGGHGNCDDELKEESDTTSNLKIHPIVPLPKIRMLEQNADILINPRPDEKEFTKYSFPSKTAEYLMMETPVLMYKLAGIPAEYDQFLNYIEENSPEGIADAIKKLLAENVEIRAKKAKNARTFILNCKNNIYQANRLYEFLSDIHGDMK